jgi:phosphoglycolate phosphatase-like HAD superfamily hydrolase
LRLVLFDVDGTLIRADGAGRGSLVAAFAETYRLDPERVADAAGRVDFRGRLDPWIHRQTARLLGLDPAEGFEAMVASYLRHLRELLERRPARVLPGVNRLLEALRKRGDALGLLTGNLRAGAREKLASCGLAGLFPEGAFGEDGSERPALGPVALRRFEARLGRRLDPAAVIVVGDTQHDVATARANGFVAVAVATGWTALDELRACDPDVLLEDLSRWDEGLLPPAPPLPPNQKIDR